MARWETGRRPRECDSRICELESKPSVHQKMIREETYMILKDDLISGGSCLIEHQIKTQHKVREFLYLHHTDQTSLIQ